jgi:hypothetical protein
VFRLKPKYGPALAARRRPVPVGDTQETSESCVDETLQRVNEDPDIKEREADEATAPGPCRDEPGDTSHELEGSKGSPDSPRPLTARGRPVPGRRRH